MHSTALNALVAGLKDGGCMYVTNYPGSHSQDIFFELGGERISANEKTAFEMAYGASLSGLRSVVSMKNVGLNTCADPYLHAVITGTQGGFVVVVTDDTRATGSQEREDSRHFIDFFGGMWLEPSSTEMAYEMAYEAFELSEKLDVPVTIRLTSQFFDLSGTYTPKAPRKGKKGMASDPQKFIAYPIYWRRQWDRLQQKRARIEAYTDSCYENAPFESGKAGGAVVVGACGAELGGAAYRDYDVLSVNHYPLPKTIIDSFTTGRSQLAVLEQGDAYAWEKITHQLGQPLLPVPVQSNTGECPDLPHQWKVWDHLEKLFMALEKLEPSFVTGDVGQYTVETRHVVDACLCLGSSVGVTLGLADSGVQYPFAVVGDGAFLHSNLSALEEARARSANFGVVVIDNGGSMATGGQPLISDIHIVDKGVKTYSIDYSAASSDDIRKILLKMKQDNTLAVLYVNLQMEETR